MKLYNCTQAPNPRRLRIALAEKGIEIDMEQIDLMKREQLETDFKTINPRGTVPALELDDGTLITESLAIALYFEDIKPEPAIFGQTPVARARIIEWNARIEFEGIAALAEVYRNSNEHFSGRALAGPLDIDQDPALVKRGLSRVSFFRSVLNDQLDSRNFIASDNYSFADISALIFCDMANNLGAPVTEEYPNLLQWYNAASARPSAKA